MWCYQLFLLVSCWKRFDDISNCYWPYCEAFNAIVIGFGPILKLFDAMSDWFRGKAFDATSYCSWFYIGAFWNYQSLLLLLDCSFSTLSVITIPILKLFDAISYCYCSYIGTFLMLSLIVIGPILEYFGAIRYCNQIIAIRYKAFWHYYHYYWSHMPLGAFSNLLYIFVWLLSF